MAKLSIIVPVFKVEKYIRTCTESIFKQGLDDEDFEVIIVNDGTPDRSMKMIDDIIQQHDNIMVINQENQGLSVARNNGLQKASGEYIQFIDSDDLLIDNTVPYLLEKALSSRADLVVADYIMMDDNQITLFSNKFLSQKERLTQEMSGKELLLHDLNPHYCFVWRTLYRREFLNLHQLRFIPGIRYEDIPFTHECYLNANQCLRVNWKFVIYRKGHESITNTFTIEKAMDYCASIAKTWELSEDKDMDCQIRKKIRNDAFVSFSMLFYMLTTNKHISHTDKLSVLKKMKNSAPNISFRNGLKQNIVNFLYQRMPNTYMTLRLFYAKYLQYICWAIGDFVRNKKKTNNKLL